VNIESRERRREGYLQRRDIFNPLPHTPSIFSLSPVNIDEREGGYIDPPSLSLSL